MIPWGLFFQIVLLMLILWMIIAGLISTWQAGNNLNKRLSQLKEAEDGTLHYSGSSDS